MRKLFLAVIIITLIIIISILYFLAKSKSNPHNFLSPISQLTEKPLEKYSFERLKNRIPKGGIITLGENVKTGPGFSSYFFNFPTEGKQVFGMMNLPDKAGTYPVLILLRGFIDKKTYTPGDGTRRDGEIFAQNGFITLAPDFLGYGESASPSASVVEERFQTYTTVLDLISSLPTLNQAINVMKNINILPDINHIGIWGHSNGGQIALSILSITGKKYPTVLWASVSKPFPFSVLYFTDEFDDHGKMLRKVIADFEKDYDSEFYTFTNYFDRINSLIQIHQGTADEAVPQKWSDQLVKELKDKQKDITYFVYPEEDHNFSKGSWSSVIQRNIRFYQQFFFQLY